MSILDELLTIEHQAIALKLGFIEAISKRLDYPLMLKALGYIDRLSRKESSEKERKTVVAISALLWTYRDLSWEGLRDYLSLVLARIGCAPSSIMIDSNYDKEHGLFSRMQSAQSELSFLYNQAKYEIKVSDKYYLLTEFQFNVWNAFNEKAVLGISAPTSAGKSFVLSLKIADLLLKGDGSVVYIVPTLSLVSQVCNDIKHRLDNVGVSDCVILTNCDREKSYKKSVFVLTQEKAISAFAQEACLFKNVILLVVDEIQNIERSDSESENRARVLYDVLINFRQDCVPKQIVLSGPRIENIKDLGIEIFCHGDTDAVETKNSPVVGLTYSIEKNGSQNYFKQYSDLSSTPKKIDITSRCVPSFSGSKYSESYLECFYRFFEKFQSDFGNLIFAPTSGTAEKISKYISEKNAECDNGNINSLSSYIKRTVRNNYTLANCVQHGIAYHHGKMPMHARNVIEYAVKNDLIGNIVCTTTLMQGVNLPAKNVIMRNPYLCVKAKDGKKSQLTNYEIANLRGRAGRLMRDFLGRTFVLAEELFEKDSDQQELFRETEKKLKSGYENIYENQKESIKEKLTESSEVGKDDFLVTYIRQRAYVYGRNAVGRLNSVGIQMTDSEIDEIIKSLNALSVPREICQKNRYWDPFVLDRIYKNQSEYDLPTNIFETGLKSKIGTLLKKIQRTIPVYYNKYFEEIDNDIIFDKRMDSIVAWMREESYPKILMSPYFNNADNIDKTLSFLQNKVSFGLSMLLKPFYDIINPESPIIQSIENGAYRPITKKIIEMNVARETAISLANSLFRDSDDLEENEIRNRIKDNLNSLEFWERIQVENI